MVKRPIRPSRLCVVALALLSTACETAVTERQAQVSQTGWRIVERTGEARYLRPAAAAWQSPTSAQTIPDGSAIETGRGGRLIVGIPGRHLSAGPGSDFVLPRAGADPRLEQRAGQLRYRIATGSGAPLRAHTPFLELEIEAAVADVRVDQGATEVTVIEGQVWVAKADGLRHVELTSGQSALALATGEQQLAMRRGPHQPLEAVAPAILPAMLPKPAAVEAPAEAAMAAPTVTLPPAPETPTPALDRAEQHAAVVARALVPPEDHPLAHAIDAPMLQAPRSAPWAEMVAPVTQDALASTDQRIVQADPTVAVPAPGDLLLDLPESTAPSGELEEAGKPVAAEPDDSAEIERRDAGSDAGLNATRAELAAAAASARAEERRKSFERLTEGMIEAPPRHNDSGRAGEAGSP